MFQKNLNLNYYCQVLLVSPHRFKGGLSGKGCSLVPHSPSVSSPPWYAAPRNSHLQKHIIPGWIGIETLFSTFQCLYVVRFEWDIVLSSSYDGWDKGGYTTWCPRGGTSTLLNCVWSYLMQKLELMLNNSLNKTKKIKYSLFPALRCTGFFQNKVSY